jgi:sigma-B regulation protein RsbU (phosphoserine phosphatase)
MPADWKKLASETSRSFDPDEVLGMWSVDWRKAREAFFEDHRAEIEAEPRRFRRGLLKANAVVYGLTRRLAPPRRLVFALALVLVVLALLENAFGDRQSGFAFLGLLVAVVAVMFLLAMELVDKLHFKDELVMARALQAQLVPRPLPEIGFFELAGESRVANTVGGDLFAFEPLPGGRVAVLFGDASGHGMAAGLVMAVTHAAFRTQLGVDVSPAAMAASLNRVLCETGSSRSFFAGICGLLEDDGTFTAIVAGHPAVLRLDGEGRVAERIGIGSYPLGIKKTTEWTPLSTSLAPGETLLFHSDGLPEARGESGGDYGDARIEAVASGKSGARPGELVAALTADLDRFLGRVPIDDDVSIAAIRRKPA